MNECFRGNLPLLLAEKATTLRQIQQYPFLVTNSEKCRFLAIHCPYYLKKCSKCFKTLNYGNASESLIVNWLQSLKTKSQNIPSGALSIASCLVSLPLRVTRSARCVLCLFPSDHWWSICLQIWCVSPSLIPRISRVVFFARNLFVFSRDGSQSSPARLLGHHSSSHPLGRKAQATPSWEPSTAVLSNEHTPRFVHNVIALSFSKSCVMASWFLWHFCFYSIWFPPQNRRGRPMAGQWYPRPLLTIDPLCLCCVASAAVSLPGHAAEEGIEGGGVRSGSLALSSRRTARHKSHPWGTCTVLTIDVFWVWHTYYEFVTLPYGVRLVCTRWMLGVALFRSFLWRVLHRVLFVQR